MALGGEQRTSKGRKVGMATFEVVSVNPTAEEIKVLYGMDESPKEPEYYSGKDVDVPDHYNGDELVKVTKTIKTARIDFYFDDTKEGAGVTKKSFFLQKRVQQKKDLTKTQFINQKGRTTWVDESKNLPVKFTSYVDKAGNPNGDILFREALVGESDLVEFLMIWLNIDSSKASANFLLDTDEFFKGNFKELQEVIGGDLAMLVTGCYTVITNEKDGGINYYQDLYKSFLPVTDYKIFASTDFSEEILQKISEKKLALDNKISHKEKIDKSDWMNRHEKWILEITDSEYGCKDAYSLKPAYEFDPNTHIATTAKVIDHASDEY